MHAFRRGSQCLPLDFIINFTLNKPTPLTISCRIYTTPVDSTEGAYYLLINLYKIMQNRLVFSIIRVFFWMDKSKITPL